MAQFQGKGLPLSETALRQVCDTLPVAVAELWAVVTVETRGFGFLASRRPLILFERHIFHDRTGGKYDKTAPNLSNATPGGYAGGTAEYPRLEAAIVLDRHAALESASWGLGQIMGFNHASAGFATVEEMVTAMTNDEKAQLQGVAGFIKSNALDAAIRRHDWAAFAKVYNGAAFKKNEYDTRLAAAHAKAAALLPNLRFRAAQAALLYLGMDPGPVDGLPGRYTRSALVKFQETRHLPVTGGLDAATEARLNAEAFPD